MIDRVLSWLDDDAPATRAAQLHAYELLFLVIMFAEYWLRAAQRWHHLGPEYYENLALASVLCIAALFTRVRRVAFLGLALSHAVLVWREFPSAGNHAYLEIVLCLLGALLSPADPRDGALYLRAVRWLVVLIFLWSGVQKLANGYWTNALYLAYALEAPTYRQVLGGLVPASELARLARYQGKVGDGPYLVASWPLLVAANATWVTEIALGPALVWARTRRLAICVALLFLFAIEAAAREIFFGLVFSNALLTFAPARVHRFAIPVFFAVLVLLTLVSAGILPTMIFY